MNMKAFDRNDSIIRAATGFLTGRAVAQHVLGVSQLGAHFRSDMPLTLPLSL